MLKPINIEATTLQDAFFQTIYQCVDHGNIFTIDEGSFAGQKRMELDYATIHICHPEALPLLPIIPEFYGIPCLATEEYLNQYILYLLSPEKKENEAYTYGERLTASKIQYSENNIAKNRKKDAGIWLNKAVIQEEQDEDMLNQVELMIWTYKNKGHRNNQMCLQIAKPEDMLLEDPPCLRHIDSRIQNNALHFFPYFRSWDLWGGLPVNLAGIEKMKQYVASEIGVKNGEIIASSKGLHLYDYVIEYAKKLRSA